MKPHKKTYRELASEFKTTKCERAFTQIYHKVKPGLLKYINKITGDPDASQDILSMTMAKVHSKIDLYNDSWQITTWIYRIAYNECMGYFRAKGKGDVAMKTLDHAREDSSSVAELLLSRQDDSLSYEEYLEEDNLLQERYRLTLEALHALPPMYKPYMIECLVNGRSHNDVAGMMGAYEKGVSIQTVKNRIFRGRRIIKSQLSGMAAFA
jgi:RNA polymerase sigma-70 factor (ECF subfamily)